MRYFIAVLAVVLAAILGFSATAAPAALQSRFACVANLAAGGEDFLALREKPSPRSDEIARLPAGSALRIIGSENEWANVEVLSGDAGSGWVDAYSLEPVDDPASCGDQGARPDTAGKGDAVTPDTELPAPTPARADFACVANLAKGDFLTLREKPAASAGEIARLPTGSALQITGSKGNWVSVEVVNGEPIAGWVNGKYLERVDDPNACAAPETVPETAGKGDTGTPVPVPSRAEFGCVANLAEGDVLTLREKPSAGAADIGHLEPGWPVRITGSSGNWFSIELPTGEAGWVNGKYLELVADVGACGGEDTKPTTADNTGTPTADETGCDEAAVLDAKGNPVFPQGATEITLPEDVDADEGLISDLYPGLDTTTDAFYENLPCEPSIGGTLPAAVDTPPTPDEVEADEYLSNFESKDVPEIVHQIEAARMPDLPELPDFTPGGCYINRKIVPCDSSAFLLPDQPFEGRDIIYVHGLDTGDFSAWLHDVPGARQPWLGPQDPDSVAAYLAPGGFFRQTANEYWGPHIRENLFDPDQPASPFAGWQYASSDSAPRYFPKSNRYLVVAWSSNNTMPYAQHALLSQIQLAITSNRNVVTPPTYPSNFVRPFCSNGCIVVGHSTGPLIVSSAMGMARAGLFGPGGKQIPDRIFAQVSFEGALSGSRLGTLGLAVGLSLSPIPVSVCLLVNELLINSSVCDSFSTAFLATSILRDLVPAVAQGVWGPWVELSPIRTVAIAGGHPIGKAAGALKYFLPGLDDGVVSMNSACGNPAPVFPFVLAPSGAMVTSLVKAFDFSTNGGRLARAIKNFISAKNLKGPFIPPLGPLYLAGGCTPYVSPTGMVMPVLTNMGGTPWDARRRYNNIYSFLQATTGHSYDGGSEASSGNPWPSEAHDPASTVRHYLDFFSVYTENNEESYAVTDSGIYAQSADGTYLIKPIPIHEVIRGKKVTFKLFGHRHTWWIWKRTYHLLDKWEVKQTTHYVYEFVARR